MTTRRLFLPAIAAAWLLSATGCSSSTPSTAPTRTPAASTTATQPGGLVGVIDAARLAAVCANAEEARTVQSVGGSTESAPLVAAAGLLERPPVDPQASAAAVSIRADLKRNRVDLALATTLAFCHAHGR